MKVSATSPVKKNFSERARNAIFEAFRYSKREELAKGHPKFHTLNETLPYHFSSIVIGKFDGTTKFIIDMQTTKFVHSGQDYEKHEKMYNLFRHLLNRPGTTIRTMDVRFHWLLEDVPEITVTKFLFIRTGDRTKTSKNIVDYYKNLKFNPLKCLWLHGIQGDDAWEQLMTMPLITTAQRWATDFITFKALRSAPPPLGVMVMEQKYCYLAILGIYATWRDNGAPIGRDVLFRNSEIETTWKNFSKRPNVRLTKIKNTSTDKLEDSITIDHLPDSEINLYRKSGMMGMGVMPKGTAISNFE